MASDMDMLLARIRSHDGTRATGQNLDPWLDRDILLAAEVVRLRGEIEALTNELAEAKVEILMEHSYEMEPGWFCHSFMADQEEALAWLVERGLWEVQAGDNLRFRSVAQEPPNA